MVGRPITDVNDTATTGCVAVFRNISTLHKAPLHHPVTALFQLDTRVNSFLCTPTTVPNPFDGDRSITALTDMEPLAIIGAAAAAFQFAEQGLTITKYLHSNISSLRKASEITQHRLELVDQLEGVFQAIVHNPSLQTDAVARLLQPALQSASKLQSDLLRLEIGENGPKWRKWSRSFRAFMQSDDIERAFDKLNRQTSALILCLQTVDS